MIKEMNLLLNHLAKIHEVQNKIVLNNPEIPKILKKATNLKKD